MSVHLHLARSYRVSNFNTCLHTYSPFVLPIHLDLLSFLHYDVLLYHHKQQGPGRFLHDPFRRERCFAE